MGDGMAKRSEKVIQQTWQKSYTASGLAHISTLTITPIRSDYRGNRLLVSSLLVDGKRDKFGTEHFIETAEKVTERIIGLRSDGYSLIDERSVALRAA